MPVLPPSDAAVATNAALRLQALRRQFPIGDADESLRKDFDAAVVKARETDLSVRPPTALMYHGLMMLQDDPPKYEEAIPFLEEALREDPSLQSAWEGLGWSYIRIEERDKARRLWDYYRELMPGEAAPYALLAQLDILDQNWIGADTNLRRALALQPKNYDWRVWYAQNLLRLGSPNEAEKVFRKLIAEDPDRFDLQVQLANILTFRLDYDEAAKILRHVNEETPGVPANMLAQARLELRLGALRRADQLCLDVLSIDSNNTAAVTLRADVAEIADLGTLSVDRLRSVVETTHDPVMRAELRMRLALRMREVRKRDRAKYSFDQIFDEMRKAIEENPIEDSYQMILAQNLYVNEDYTEARKWAINILEKFNPNHVMAKQLLFEIALQDRRFADADQILNDIYAKYDATDPMRWFYLARLQTARGEYADALATLDKMEKSVEKGTVLTLLYHDLTESDWVPVTSVRRLSEHLLALQREGWTLVSPAELPKILHKETAAERVAADAERAAAGDDGAEYAEDVPTLARIVDWVRWEFTGHRRLKKGSRTSTKATPYLEPGRPMKVFTVTFDDGLRSALQLGEGVSKDFGVPFAMFVGTRPSPDYRPSVAGWSELREAARSGAWIIGSHLYGAHEPGVVDPDSSARVHALVNRLWQPEPGRLESMNEWDRRMRNEFRISRGILDKEMGTNRCPVEMVAYPYGDIGQTSYSNLRNVRNPVNSIISEAARHYQLGFVESIGGYTSVGDNLLTIRRYEPMWTDEGDDVVAHAYDSHPSFMARRMRVEIAFLMNKPHMADDMIESLRRDGYPEERCNAIRREVRVHFRNSARRSLEPLVTSSSVVGVDQAGGRSLQDQHRSTQSGAFNTREDGANVVMLRDDGGLDQDRAISDLPDDVSLSRVYREGDLQQPLFKLSAPSVGFSVFDSKANDQYHQLGYEINGGVNINPKLRLSASYRHSELEQRIVPRYNRDPKYDTIRWVDQVNNQYAYSHNKEEYDELASDPNYKIDNRKISSYKYKFKAYRDDFRGRLTYRTDDGVTFSGSLGQSSLDLNPNGKNPHRYAQNEDGTTDEDATSEYVGFVNYADPNDGTEDGRMIGDLSVAWSPRDDMDIYWFYSHDLAESAVDEFTLDTMGVVLNWKPGDLWEFNTRWQYWTYENDNNMFYIQGDGYYNIDPDIGFWIGVDASVVNSSEGCDYYWTPAWDERAMAVLRYKAEWIGYSFTVDLLGGLHKEGVHGLTRSEDADIIGNETGWDWCYGAATRYSKRLNRYADLFIDARVMSLKQYVDHSLMIGFTLTF